MLDVFHLPVWLAAQQLSGRIASRDLRNGWVGQEKKAALQGAGARPEWLEMVVNDTRLALKTFLWTGRVFLCDCHPLRVGKGLPASRARDICLSAFSRIVWRLFLVSRCTL